MKNPFRMFGTWAGIILGAVLAYFSFDAILTFAELGISKPIAFVLPFLVLVIFFLLGWSVHVLVIKFLEKHD